MNNYKRIISYIYMYENVSDNNVDMGMKTVQRIRNVGFVKIDGRHNTYKLQLSIKTPCDYSEEKLYINLIVETNDGYRGIKVGSLRPITESVQFKCLVDKDNIADTGVNFGRVCGVYITARNTYSSVLNEKYYFLCQWAEEEFDVNKYEAYQEIPQQKLVKAVTNHIEKNSKDQRRNCCEHRRKVYAGGFETS